MQLLYDRGGRAPGSLDDGGLLDLYRHAPSDRPGRVRLRTNFVASLDGSIQGPDGRSATINTPSDHHVFALQRACADAIMVGAGTVRAEGYRAVDLAPWQLEIREHEALPAFPTLVIITRSGVIDPVVARPSQGPGGPVMIITTTGKPGSALDPLRDAGTEVVELPGLDVDLVAATALLAGRGLRRVVCEGGPRLHRDLLAADLVDELSLTIAAVVVGGVGQRSTSGAALPALRRFRLQHVLYAEDQTLFTAYHRET